MAEPQSIVANLAFEVVTDAQWNKLFKREDKHANVVKALEFLKENPTKKVRIKILDSLGRRKADAVRDHATRKGLYVKTNFRDGYLYIRIAEPSERRG